MKAKTKVFWFKIWAEILLVASVITSLYVKFFTTYQLAWGTVILLIVIVVLYFYGKYIERQETRHYY